MAHAGACLSTTLIGLDFASMSALVQPIGHDAANAGENDPSLTREKAWRDKASADLGWPEVLERIAEHAVTEATVTRLLNTLPFEAQSDAQAMHARVFEAIALHDRGARLPLRRIEDLTEALGALERGAPASGRQLHDLAVCLDLAVSLRHHAFTHSEYCPTLARDFSVDPNLAEIARALHSSLDEQGQLFDHASAGLQSARKELDRAREALRSEQAQLLRKYKDQLSGAYFAEREGRFVLPVRTDAARVEGAVLGSSGSGGTLYVEPVEMLEKNNRTRIAEALVHREETRILAELSALAGARVAEIQSAYEACLLGDRVGASAAWAVRHGATPVAFADEPVLRLDQMRHPLLLPRSNAPQQKGALVANNFELLPGQALILSGPNAGGKTVALKCLGLAAWLAKSGLPVPCAPSSAIGWFDEVFTDVGDDQSISRSLSTFSAHITNLAHCLTDSRRGVLLLLDEIAGGTDPDEGAALAVAILEAFCSSGASVATTTHYERLKQLGAREGGPYRNASVGFDMDRMRPTFRVTMGIPGASSALAVAERYGIPHSVVERAKAAMPKESRDQQQLIVRLEQELERATAARQAHEDLVADAERRREAFEREREHVLRGDRLVLERLSAELTKEVLDARADLRRAKALLGATSRDAYREAEALVNSAALPITLDGNLTMALKAASVPSARRESQEPQSSNLTTGTVVRLNHLGTEAVVVEPPNKGQVRVSVGGLKMSVPLAQIQLPAQKKPPAARPVQQKNRSNGQRQRSTEASQTSLPSADLVRTTHNTCDLRGQRVDDGLILVDQFLDEMLRMREPAAFILHGHGTGAMKAAVREHLAGSRLVKHFEAATPNNGGDAFTVAWLA